MAIRAAGYIAMSGQLVNSSLVAAPTHNPNLVVNADSEQVVVATAERRENGLPHVTY